MNLGPWQAVAVESPISPCWHDGDTGHFNIDLGFDIIESAFDLDGKPKLSARIYGINAPELGKQEPQATQAKEYAESICPVGTRVTILSHDWDKFGGRFDASIILPEVHTSVDGQYTGDDFATLMLHSNTGTVVET